MLPRELCMSVAVMTVGILVPAGLEGVVATLLRGGRLEGALPSRVLRQLAAHTVELAVGVMVFGVTSTVAVFWYAYLGNSLLKAPPYGDCGFLALAGYFIYHLHRLLALRITPRSLISHHIIVVIALLSIVAAGTAYGYGLLIGLASVTAVLRDFKWIRRSLSQHFQLPAVPRTVDLALQVVFDMAVPVLGMIHFVTIGRRHLQVSNYVSFVLVSLCFGCVGIAFFFGSRAIAVHAMGALRKHRATANKRASANPTSFHAG